MPSPQRQAKRFLFLEPDQLPEIPLELKDNYYVHSYDEQNIVEDELYQSSETKRLRVEELARQHKIVESKLMRKIDLCVIPPFALLYLISFMNKATFGMIYLNGITGLLGGMLSTALVSAFAAFFVPIICFQFGANVILRIIRPHFVVSSTVLLYGAFNLSLSFSQNYSTLVALQFFHGLFQAGTETTVIYMLAHYYSRTEAPIRFGSLYLFNALGGALINFMSWGIFANLNGALGLESWRWILIIVGAITMFLAIILFFTVPDFPESARFFNDAETYFLVKKLEIYGGKSGYNIRPTFKEYLKVLRDPLILLPPFAGVFIGYVSTAYCTFEPTIFKLIIFSVEKANKNLAWAYLLGFGWINIFMFVTQKWSFRYAVFFFNTLIAIAGALLYICDRELFSTNYKLAGNYLLVCGTFCCMPILACWTTMNVCGHTRKAVITSLEISFHDLGGLVSLFVMVHSDLRYRKGLITGISMAVFGLILLAIYSFILYRSNKIKRSNAYKEKFSMLSEREKILMGDKSPGYDYVY